MYIHLKNMSWFKILILTIIVFLFLIICFIIDFYQYIKEKLTVILVKVIYCQEIKEIGKYDEF